MPKRGRPSTHGVKPGNKLLLTMVVVLNFDKAREAGEKRSVAILEAVAAAKAKYPVLAVSETEVKRILAEYRPRGLQEGYFFRESVIEGEEAAERHSLCLAAESLLDERPKRRSAPAQALRFRTITCYEGKIPQYPRSNAKSPKKK